MRWIKSFLLFVLLLVSVLVGVVLFLYNDQTLAVNLVWFQTPEASAAVWLMTAFCLGLTLGVSISLVAYLWIKGRTWGLKKKVQKLEKQVSTPTLPGQVSTS